MIEDDDNPEHPKFKRIGYSASEHVRCSILGD